MWKGRNHKQTDMGYSTVKTLSINPAERSKGSVYLQRTADAVGAIQAPLHTVRLNRSGSSEIHAVNWYLPTRQISMGRSCVALLLRAALVSLMVVTIALCGVWEFQVFLALLAVCVLSGMATRPLSIALCGGALAAIPLFGFETSVIVLGGSVFVIGMSLAICGPGRFSCDALWRRRIVRDIRRANSLNKQII